MILVAWILFIACGFFSVHGVLRVLSGQGLNWFHALFWLMCTVLAAVSAGVIWGGLVIG